MTIREIYNYAKRHQAEDYEVGVSYYDRNDQYFAKPSEVFAEADTEKGILEIIIENY